jgi:hypothetical protein
MTLLQPHALLHGLSFTWPCMLFTWHCLLFTLNFTQDIIGKFPDLMEGFNRFLARCETMDAVDNEMRGQFGQQRGISQREMQRLKGVSAR